MTIKIQSIITYADRHPKEPCPRGHDPKLSYKIKGKKGYICRHFLGVVQIKGGIRAIFCHDIIDGDKPIEGFIPDLWSKIYGDMK